MQIHERIEPQFGPAVGTRMLEMSAVKRRGHLTDARRDGGSEPLSRLEAFLFMLIAAAIVAGCVGVYMQMWSRLQACHQAASISISDHADR
jgi:hypothetical protein